MALVWDGAGRAAPQFSVGFLTMSRFITNKAKQKAVSDPTGKPNKYMKSWTAKKLRLNIASDLKDQTSNHSKPTPGKDRLSYKKKSGICPVCEKKLHKNEKKTRYENRCHSCGAVLQKNKICFSCGTNRVWNGRSGAVCKGCGKNQT